MIKEYNKITIKNLNKSFGENRVLRDFNLTIDRGEFVTFLGPSGCGKSTALNCITGLIPITSGEIYIDDECLDNGKNISVPPEKRGFGMVFQNYALFPHLTVFKNISFGLELKKVDKREINQRVTMALKLVHLEGYENKFPMQLSGGQQQRVAIARAVVMEPRLLLLDEPLSNLDAKLRLEMRHELKALHDRLHITSIYVTHDQHEALALSDKIVVMRNGVIQQVGTPEEIYSSPANLFVADFMGYQNKWQARITSLHENNLGLDITIDTGFTTLNVKVSKQANRERVGEIKEAYSKNQDIIAAVRPDDINLKNSDLKDTEMNVIRCKVNSVEYLGQMFHVSSHLSNQQVVEARLSTKVNMDDLIDLYIPPAKIVVFTKDME